MSSMDDINHIARSACNVGLTHRLQRIGGALQLGSLRQTCHRLLGLCRDVGSIGLGRFGHGGFGYRTAGADAQEPQIDRVAIGE